MPKYTHYNYIITQFKFPELMPLYFKEISLIKNFQYLIGQLEICPKTQRIHIQAYFEFNKEQSKNEIKSIMSGVHLENRKGTQAQAIAYCSKLDTRHSEPITIGTPKKQGSRTDITSIRLLIKEGKSLKEIILNHASNFQTIRITEKLFQYGSKPRDTASPPEVRWYYGKTGTGKTRSVYTEFTDIYPSFSYKWWDGYEQNNVILIDDMRKDYAKFHILLKLLDRFPHIVQIKGGTIHIKSPLIIITSAYHPKDLYRTREDINQLLRRITRITKFSLHEGESVCVEQKNEFS